MQKIIKRVIKTIARLILPSRAYFRLLKSWDKRAGRKCYEALEGRGWKNYLDNPRMDPILKKMILSYERSQSKDLTSNYWTVLNSKNLVQLLESGFENFKQTIALNYFTFLVDENNLQVKFIKKNLSSNIVEWAEKESKASRRHQFFEPKQSRFYNFMTFMLWKYTEEQVGKNMLDRLEEPLIGNPPAVELNGKRISQDLANSVLEYQSIANGVGDFRNIQTVLELGTGYGRTAYVILCLNPHIRYAIVDIPPALYISQRYLSGIFPDKKIFAFRDFDNFSGIEDEFRESEIVFLLPSQLKFLPNKMADLFLAIDCLHEMRLEQIDFYFNAIDRLAKRLYFTCAKTTPVPYEDIVLEEKDYPVRSHWTNVFWRTRRVQDHFFEAFFLL